jgi:hypothetical protein
MPRDDAPKGRGPQPRPAPPSDAAQLIENNQRAMRAALEVQSQGFQHMAKIGTSVLEFVQRRLQHDVELAQRLGTARAPQDAYAAYTDFFDVAVKEYSSEFSELATLYVDQAEEAMQEAEHGTARGAEHAPDDRARPAATAAE